jgi:hypothetical protein
MKSKSEFKKQNSAAQPKKQMLQYQGADTEFIWVQSSDFFRTSPVEAKTSAESASVNQFNSEF